MGHSSRCSRKNRNNEKTQFSGVSVIWLGAVSVSDSQTEPRLRQVCPPAEMNRHHYALYVHNCRLVLLLRKDFDLADTFRPAEFHWKLDQVPSSGTLPPYHPLRQHRKPPRSLLLTPFDRESPTSQSPPPHPLSTAQGITQIPEQLSRVCLESLKSLAITLQLAVVITLN